MQAMWVQCFYSADLVICKPVYETGPQLNAGSFKKRETCLLLVSMCPQPGENVGHSNSHHRGRAAILVCCVRRDQRGLFPAQGRVIVQEVLSKMMTRHATVP